MFKLFYRFPILMLLLALLIVGCSKQYVATQYQYTGTRVVSGAVADRQIDSMIAPYRDSMQKIMNEFLVINETLLTKGQPESTLGNLLAEVLLEEANLCCGKKVDVALMNNGGIRIPELAAGNVTLGKVYELMPFENRLVLTELSSADFQSLMNAIAAAGGWPIAGVRFVIKNKKATNITIGNEPFNIENSYTIALSDYLMEGGDNLNMLKGKPLTDSGKNLREAFVDAFKRKHANGEKLKSRLDGRIVAE